MTNEGGKMLTHVTLRPCESPEQGTESLIRQLVLQSDVFGDVLVL